MRVILALLLILLPSLCAATPPRIVSVEEDLLAVNATHLFVLRRISDNQGYHQVDQTDVTLIARNRQTGVDDQHWPVLSIRDNGSFSADEDPDARVTNLGLPERVNPYDIVLWRMARLIRGEGRYLDGLSVSISGDLFTLTDGDERFHFALTQTHAAIEQSLVASRATIPYPTDHTRDEMRQDYLFGTPVDLREGCAVAAMHHLYDEVNDPAAQRVIKLNCDNADRPLVVFIPLHAAQPQN